MADNSNCRSCTLLVVYVSSLHSCFVAIMYTYAVLLFNQFEITSIIIEYIKFHFKRNIIEITIGIANIFILNTYSKDYWTSDPVLIRYCPILMKICAFWLWSLIRTIIMLHNWKDQNCLVTCSHKCSDCIVKKWRRLLVIRNLNLELL